VNWEKVITELDERDYCLNIETNNGRITEVSINLGSRHMLEIAPHGDRVFFSEITWDETYGIDSEVTLAELNSPSEDEIVDTATSLASNYE
jgi:hypothetical protein